MGEQRVYDVKDLVSILGVSRITIYELLKKHEFSWRIIGNKYVISKKSFDKWLDESESTDSVREEDLVESTC